MQLTQLKGAEKKSVPFIKNQNSEDFLKQALVAYNGQVLMIKNTEKTKMYAFDMSTGQRFHKINL